MTSLAKRVVVFGGGVVSSLFLFNAVDKRLYEKGENQHALQAEGPMTTETVRLTHSDFALVKLKL